MAKLREVGVLTRYSRFLIPLILCFVMGNVLAAYQPALPWLAGWQGSSWLCLFAGVVVLSGTRKVILLCGWLAGLVIGGMYYQTMAFQPGLTDVSRFTPNYAVRVEGEIQPYAVGANKTNLTVKTVNGQSATGTLLLRTGHFPLPEAGSWVSVDGRLMPPRKNAIPGGFDERQFLYSQQITAVLSHVSHLDVTHLDPITWQGALNRHLSRMLNRIADVFKSQLPSPQAEVLGSVVLGDHAMPVDPDIHRQFIDTGLVHLLAASGMNVGIVAAFLFFVCTTLCRLPFRLTLAIAMLGVAAYSCLTGLPPSIQRAAVMLELALMFKLMNRQVSALYSLCLSLLILILWNPVLVTSIGFQLSVVTTFGLITMVPPLERWLAFYLTRWGAGTLLIPLVAQVWVCPLLIHYFNQFPLFSVVLNILVVPIVSLLTCLGFMAGLLALVWPPVAAWLVMISGPLVILLLWLVKMGQQWGAVWTMPTWTPMQLTLIYAGLLLVTCLLSEPGQEWLRQQQEYWTDWADRHPAVRKKTVLASLGLGVLTLIMLGVQSTAPDVSASTITVLPLSYRQAAFVLKPQDSNQTVLLIPDSLSLWQGKDLLDYFQHYDIHKVDALLTWPSSSRRGGTEGLALLTKSLAIQRQLSFNPEDPASLKRLRLGNITVMPAFISGQTPVTVVSYHRCLMGDASVCPIRQIDNQWQFSGFPIRYVHQLVIDENRLAAF